MPAPRKWSSFLALTFALGAACPWRLGAKPIFGATSGIPPSVTTAGLKLDTNWYPTQKSRRCYHRVISGIERGGALRFLTLTSSNESPDTCQRSFRALSMRLKRRGLMQGYIKVPEQSKNDKQHLHVLFRGSYIDQALVSHWWQEIHKAPVVDIRLVKSKRSPKRLASYMAKYMSKENIYRYSWDWGWVWRGFVRDWKDLKRLWNSPDANDIRRHFFSAIQAWQFWLHGDWKPDFTLLLSGGSP